MPVFIGVRCVCGAFQVIQAPKNKKFNCKVCGAKAQSVRKVYARSTAAKDVRGVVMALNMTRAGEGAPTVPHDWEDEEWDEEGGVEGEREGGGGDRQGSRWAAFIDEGPADREPEGYRDDHVSTHCMLANCAWVRLSVARLSVWAALCV